MESEKVKEIKKKLQQIKERELSSLAMILQFKIDVNDILTLIKELESENKELKKYKLDWLNGEKMHLQAEMEETEFELYCANKSLKKVREENQQLKDRIAELEEGIAKSMLGYEFLPECTNEKLKRFAERLKEKMNEGEYMGEKYKLSVFRDIDIDEILEEFVE